MNKKRTYIKRYKSLKEIGEVETHENDIPTKKEI
jgi:hypothetical protein